MNSRNWTVSRDWSVTSTWIGLPFFSVNLNLSPDETGAPTLSKRPRRKPLASRVEYTLKTTGGFSDCQPSMETEISALTGADWGDTMTEPPCGAAFVLNDTVYDLESWSNALCEIVAVTVYEVSADHEPLFTWKRAPCCKTVAWFMSLSWGSSCQ